MFIAVVTVTVAAINGHVLPVAHATFNRACSNSCHTRCNPSYPMGQFEGYMRCMKQCEATSCSSRAQRAVGSRPEPAHQPNKGSIRPATSSSKADSKQAKETTKPISESAPVSQSDTSPAEKRPVSAEVPATTTTGPGAETTTLKRRIALVIGNSAYQFAPNLTNPANDEADVAQVLRALNFDVVEGQNLDRHGMEEAIRQFGHKLNDADLALFFYSGHGLQVEGKNYLVPVDAKLERVSDLSLDAIDMGTVLAQMESDQRVNLVFLDACRDNPLVRSLARSIGNRSITLSQGFRPIEGALGTMIAYSTQPDNVALDGTGRNSPFTTALVKHLTDHGIDIDVVMKRVRADVIAATHQKQIPWDHSSLVGEVVLAP